MSSKEMNEEVPSQGFTLTSNPVFSTRSNDIFASLDVLEQKHSAFQQTQATSDSLEHAGLIKCDPVHEDETSFQGRNSDRGYDSNSTFHHRSGQNRPQNRGSRHSESKRNLREDCFQRPRPYRPKKVPDFKKHPERYTSYSLEDVAESDMSDKSNKRAALDFLFERKNERERMERLASGLPAEEEKFESDSAACSKGLISFSKSKSKREKKMDTDGRSHVTGFDDRYEDLVDEERNASKGVSSESISGADVILETSCIDTSHPNEKKECKESLFKFKSRKNVKKNIRTRDDSDE